MRGEVACKISLPLLEVCILTRGHGRIEGRCRDCREREEGGSNTNYAHDYLPEVTRSQDRTT